MIHTTHEYLMRGKLRTDQSGAFAVYERKDSQSWRDFVWQLRVDGRVVCPCYSDNCVCTISTNRDYRLSVFNDKSNGNTRRPTTLERRGARRHIRQAQLITLNFKEILPSTTSIYMSAMSFDGRICRGPKLIVFA